jgi:hypothetical protein
VNGELANVIALALHGSAWLAKTSAPLPELESTNSTFQYVARVQYELPERRWRRTRLLAGSGAWLSWLRKSGAERLWLVFPPDTAEGDVPAYISAGFAGSRRWGVLASGGRPTVWVPGWEVGDQGAPDNRIWNVAFAGSEYGHFPEPVRPSILDSAEALRLAVVDARDFAHSHNLQFWADRFDEAIRRGEAADPEIPFHPDIAPRSAVSTDVLRLLAMASASWVFGGMGSWNDLWLDDPAAGDRYKDVSERLYDALLGAFAAATNSSLAG